MVEKDDKGREIEGRNVKNEGDEKKVNEKS